MYVYVERSGSVGSIDGLLVRDSLPAESMRYVLEQYTLSAA